MSTPDFDRARAEAMIAAYDTRWAEDAYDVLAVEKEFRAPLVNPETGAPSRTWQRGGKVDAVVRDGGGRVLLVEHKTTSEDLSPGSDYWKRLRMDGQISGYLIGAESAGFKAEAVLYDVLRKPLLRPYQPSARRASPETPVEFRERCLGAIAAEPDTYFRRGEVVRLETEQDETLYDDWQTAQQLREGTRLGRFPRNPGACYQYGRMCSFFPVCTGETSIENDALYRRESATNPELAGSEGLPVLTASRLKAGRSCQRLHKFLYLDGYRPVHEAESLTFGSLLHLALAAWWSAERGERLSAALTVLRTAPESAGSREEILA